MKLRNWIGGLYRSLLLAPFGGERSLLLRAVRGADPCAGPVCIYAGSGMLSMDGAEARIQEKIPLRPGATTAVAVSFVFAADSDHRPRLREISRALAPGALLVVLDHNAPRRAMARALAATHLGLGWLLAPALPPRRRMRYPVARELRDLGFDVVRLRLLGREFFQAVAARKR